MKEFVKGERPNEIMIVNGREAEGEKASEFIKQYAIVNRVILNKDDRDKRKNIAWIMTEYVKSISEFDREFSEGEMRLAMKGVNKKRKEGRMGLNLRFPNEGINEWLNFFNRNEDMCSGAWMKAEVIPILKNGKDLKRRES